MSSKQNVPSVTQEQALVIEQYVQARLAYERLLFVCPEKQVVQNTPKQGDAENLTSTIPSFENWLNAVKAGPKNGGCTFGIDASKQWLLKNSRVNGVALAPSDALKLANEYREKAVGEGYAKPNPNPSPGMPKYFLQTGFTNNFNL